MSARAKRPQFLLDWDETFQFDLEWPKEDVTEIFLGQKKNFSITLDIPFSEFFDGFWHEKLQEDH